MGSGPPHGFARNSCFQVTKQSDSFVVLTLSSDSAKGKLPQAFVLQVTVALSDDHGGQLSQRVRLAHHGWSSEQDIDADPFTEVLLV